MTTGDPGGPPPTLPDYLRPGLRLVFVGINPGLSSACRGHYFARRTNRFWPALSRSRLSAPIRAALGRAALGPEDDARLPDFGIGFTDVVKTPSGSAADLAPAEFARGAPELLRKLEWAAPSVACFQGITGYRAFVRHGLGEDARGARLGLQPRRLGPSLLFVVPNPSPANAHVTPAEQVAWYDRLADLLDDPAGVAAPE
ncbi:MAG TPA: mismatch-specific DNA-glycosylase [Thermomicrobiaceae bacterium]|nr:mismatch-specific DNA-glycosylase [Thermomicrobiaceae bacterium]